MFKVKVAAISAVVISGFMWQADAATWRLNPDESAKADFTSIAAAMDDERVQPGDELLLDPGYYAENDLILAKENITITGSGYFFSENYDWPDARTTEINRIRLSNGSKIQGCYISGRVGIVNSSIVSRCYVKSIDSGTVLYGSYTDVTIEGCYVCNAITNFQLSNSVIRNNIIIGSIWVSGGLPHTNIVVEYNTVINNPDNSIVTKYCLTPSITASQIRNNIFINRREEEDGYTALNPEENEKYGYYSDYYNNVLSIAPENANASYPNNYYVGATVENTFVDELIADRYFLRDDSPAKGKASDGGDCGAFGGPTPYVLSGIPQYTPHITQAVIPSKPTGGALKVQLKIAVQDE